MRTYKITATITNEKYANKYNEKWGATGTFGEGVKVSMGIKQSKITLVKEIDLELNEMRKPESLKELKKLINRYLKKNNGEINFNYQYEIKSYKDIKVERYYKERENK